MDRQLKATLTRVAEFYDKRKVGDSGPLGFRRSTDLMTLLACVERLVAEGIIVQGRTTFLDLGCADGRVNLFLSYLVGRSVGIELDEWTLDEYLPLKSRLEAVLQEEGLPGPSENVFLFHGDAVDERLHEMIARKTGLDIGSFDLFYTYLVMHDAFAEMLAAQARRGAIFMVFGLNAILPRYPGFRLLEHLSPMEGHLALYEKI